MPDRRTVFIGALLFFIAALIVGGAVYFAVRLGSIIIWVILAWIIATGLAPFVDRLEQWRVGRIAPGRAGAVAIVFLGLLVFLIGVGLLFGIPAGRQIGSFLQDSNEYLYQLSLRWERIQRHAAWLPDLTGIVDRLLAYVKQKMRDDPGLAQLGLDFLKALAGLVTVLVLTLYMLLQPPRVDRLADLAAPEERRARLRAAFAAVSRKFRRWLRAQFILSLTIGLMTFVGMLLLGVRYPHFLALVSATGELIPIAGPLLAAIPAVAVAFTQAPQLALAVAAWAAFIQAFENYFLAPKVMHDVVGVPPLVTIVGLMVGYELLGVLGAILAVPVAAALGLLIPEVVGALTAPAPLSDAGQPGQQDSPRSSSERRGRRAASG